MDSAKRRLDPTHTFFLGGLHLACLLVFLFPPNATDFVLFLVGYILTGFGVTVGYHRFLTHRAFEGPRWLRRFFAVLGAGSLEGGPIVWVGTHRRHHSYSDKQGRDPHTPNDGFFWSHIGWILTSRDKEEDRKRASDLARDPFMVWLDDNHFLVWVLGGVVCWAIGGWSGVLYGLVVRTVWTWNVTWSVNSFCHVFGKRTYDTPEGSRNLWWVGLLALGEGWHNNHHAYQRSAYAGETRWQIDPAGWVVFALEKSGIITDVKRSPALRRLTPETVVSHLKTREGAERVLASDRLASFRGTAAVTEIIRSLEDESAVYRARAAQALGRIGDARAVDALIGLLSDGASQVRHEAVVALGHLTPTDKSIGALRAYLEECADEVAEVARRVLSQLETAPATT
jgi:stearoyl-CoA desaturase (delta-9 desaturase)